MKNLNQIQTIVTELKAEITKNINCIDNHSAIYKMVGANTSVFNLDYSGNSQDDITDILIRGIYQKLKNDILDSIVKSSVNVTIK